MSIASASSGVARVRAQARYSSSSSGRLLAVAPGQGHHPDVALAGEHDAAAGQPGPGGRRSGPAAGPAPAYAGTCRVAYCLSTRRTSSGGAAYPRRSSHSGVREVRPEASTTRSAASSRGRAAVAVGDDHALDPDVVGRERQVEHGRALEDARPGCRAAAGAGGTTRAAAGSRPGSGGPPSRPRAAVGRRSSGRRPGRRPARRRAPRGRLWSAREHAPRRPPGRGTAGRARAGPAVRRPAARARAASRRGPPG